MKFTTERIIPHQADCEPMLKTHMARYRFVEPYTREAVVLDAGCGAGYGSHHLATNGARSVLGVDISGEAVEYARSRYSVGNLEYRMSDIRALDAAEGSFDTVVCLEVLEHVRDQQGLLAKVRKVLKPGGSFIVSTPNADLFSPKGEPINPWHVREFSRVEFEDVLAPHFEDVRLWGQTVNAPGALGTTLLHLRIQRHLTTSTSRLTRSLESLYDRVRSASMASTRLATKAMRNDPVVIAEADEIPPSRTWYYLAVGRKPMNA